MATETTPSSEALQPDLAATEATMDSAADGESEGEAIDIIPEPGHFEDWNLAPALMRALTDMGYDRPMPVQEAVFKTLTEGGDMMVQSKTGSGKTAAFGIPIAQLLSDGKKGVQSLILAPTRELALQVAKEIEKLVEHMDVAVVPIYGGAPIGPQIQKLADGGQIVAGTPGRVLDHIRRKTMDTSGIRLLVLDECDEMLSMGFQEEIENIISTLPAKTERQTMLFSATIPKEIERIGRRHMREPEMLSLSSDSVGAELIDHYYYVVNGMGRHTDLLKLMKAEKPDSAIIFCNTRDETNTVARFLCKNGYDAEPLSSDLSQADRERVMGRMRDKNLNFLVATDIAARGIDISELSHVINYTFPMSPEVYVHRSGRTGRAGKEGTALSLVGPREIGAFYYLKLIYKIIPTERDLPNAIEMAAIEEGELYEKVIAMLEGDPRKDHLALARRLWQSNEGERVFGLLLQQLLTKNTEKTRTASKPAARISSAPAPRRERSSEADEERPARRRKRRNGAEASSPAPEVSTEAVAAAEIATTEAPALTHTAEATPAASEASEEKPKRKRRRRRGQESDVSASADASSEDATADVQASAASSGTAAVEEVEAAAPKDAAMVEEGATENNSEEAEAVAVSDAEVPAEKPRRKRRRRGRGGEEQDETTSESSAKGASEPEAMASEPEAMASEPEAKASEPEAKEKPKKSAAASSPKRARKTKKEVPVHGEFWEAWADSKDETPGAPETASSADSKSEEEESSKPAKKRRRRRRGGKESSETEAGANSDESTEVSVASEDETAPSEDTNEGSSVRLFVNVGKREDADVDAIRTFLSEALGDSAEGLGRITLRNTHCYIRVPEDLADEVIDTCTGLVFQERDVVVERARAKR